jgi:tape measure domain-containing protein
MPKVGVAYVSIRARLDRLEKDLNTAKSTTLRRANETSAAVSKVFKGAVAYFGVTQIKAFGESLFDAGKQISRLKKSFTEITGSTEAADREFSFLRQTADDLGQNFYSLTDSYKSFIAATKGTVLAGQQTRDIFIGVTKAGTTLGISNEKMVSALNAVQKMMSTGTIQADEFRQQFAEAIPIALSAATEATGTTTAEFNKLLNSGKLLSEDFIPKLAKVLNRYSGSVDDATNASNKLDEAWMDFKIAIGDGSFMNDATEAIKNLTVALNSEGLQDGFRVLIGLLGDTANAIANLVQSTAGWAAVGRGDLGFFEFATMNSKELSDWLQKNRSDVGRLDLEIKKLNEQLTKESSFFAFSSGAQAAKQSRIDDIISKIKELKQQKNAIMLGGYDSPITYLPQSTKKQSQTDSAAEAQKEIDNVDKALKSFFKDVDRTNDLLNGIFKKEQDALEEYRDAMDNFSDLSRSTNDISDSISYDIDSYDELYSAISKVTEAQYIREKALKDEFELQKALRDVIDDTYDADMGNDFASQMDKMQAVFDKTKTGADIWADSMKDAFSGWATSYASTLNDMLWNSELTFDGILESFGKMITQMIIQGSMKNIISGAGSFDWASLFTTASQGHTGGRLVDGPQRSVPTTLFSHAPRLHSGLAADEFPAILQRGETVIPRGGSNKPIDFSMNIKNQTGANITSNDVRIVQPSPGKYIAEMVLKQKQTSKGFRKRMSVK